MDVSVSLPDDLSRYVEAEISSGRYASSSEVLRDALRLMEFHARSGARLRRLLEAWRQGIDSGDFGEIDFAALKAEARAKMSPAKP